jgi:hypothetical protein
MHNWFKHRPTPILIALTSQQDWEGKNAIISRIFPARNSSDGSSNLGPGSSVLIDHLLYEQTRLLA